MTFTNIDPIEIAKFDKLAQNWWDHDGELRTLHDINPLRLKFIQDQVDLPGKHVLDIGCGGGILSEELAKSGAKVTGIDASEEAINIAKLHSQKNHLNIDYFMITVEDFAKNNPSSFDIITCMELLEHIPDPNSLIRACAQLLKPKGKLFLSTINRNIKAYLSTILGAEYILQLLPTQTHEYDKFIRPAELAHWLRDHSFTVEQLHGMTYNPLTRVAKLTDDVSVNYLVYCQLT